MAALENDDLLARFLLNEVARPDTLSVADFFRGLFPDRFARSGKAEGWTGITDADQDCLVGIFERLKYRSAIGMVLRVLPPKHLPIIVNKRGAKHDLRPPVAIYVAHRR